MNPRKINDQSLEWAIAAARWIGAIWALGGFVGVALSAGFDSWNWAITSGMFVAGGFGLGWWGWWDQGNEEWREANRADKPLCTAASTIQLEDGTWYERRCAKDLGHRSRQHLDDNPFIKTPEWT